MKYIQLVTDPSKVMMWEGKSVIAFNKTSKKVMFGGEESASSEYWICSYTSNNWYDEDDNKYYIDHPKYNSFAEAHAAGGLDDSELEHVEGEWYGGSWYILKVVECPTEEATDQYGNTNIGYVCISETKNGNVYGKALDAYVNNAPV